LTHARREDIPPSAARENTKSKNQTPTKTLYADVVRSPLTPPTVPTQNPPCCAALIPVVKQMTDLLTTILPAIAKTMAHLATLLEPRPQADPKTKAPLRIQLKRTRNTLSPITPVNEEKRPLLLIQTPLPHTTPEQTDNPVDDDEYETMSEEEDTCSTPPQLAIGSQSEAKSSLATALEMLATSSQEIQAATSQMTTLKSNLDQMNQQYQRQQSKQNKLHR